MWRWVGRGQGLANGRERGEPCSLTGRARLNEGGFSVNFAHLPDHCLLVGLPHSLVHPPVSEVQKKFFYVYFRLASYH